MPKPSSGSSLDTGNALYSALTHVWAFLEGSGASSNDSKGTNHLTLNGSVTWATEGTDPVIAMASAIARPAVLAAPVTLDGLSNWSIFFAARQIAANNAGTIAGAFNDTVNNIWFNGLLSQLTYRNSTNNARIFSVPAGFTSLANYALVYTQASGQVAFYLNGTLVGTVALGASTGTLVIDTIGNGYPSSSVALVGRIAYFYVCNGYAATAGDVAAINANPYGIFPGPPASSYTLSGPSSGTAGAAASFTVTPNGAATGVVITPASSGSGTFSPSSVTLSGSTAATFTYTPSSTSGSPHTISVTNSGALANPASVAYTVNAATGTVTLGVIRRVDQRSGASVSKPVAGAYSGEVASVQCRVLLAVDSSVVVDWSTVAAAVAGTWSGSVTVPNGGPYIIQARGINSSGGTGAPSANSATFLVGDVFLVTGQSNAIGRGDGLQSYTGSRVAWMVNEAGVIANLANPWSINNTANNGSIGPLLASLIDASQAVPTIWMVVGKSGLSVTNWASGGEMRTLIAAQVSTLNPNSIKACIWIQGEADAIGAMSQATYAAAEADFASYVASLPGSPPLISTCLAEVQSQTTNIDAIQRAKVTNWSSLATRPGPFPMPINLSADALHYSTSGELAQFAALWWFAVEAVCYSGTRARGPRLVSATSDSISNNLVLTFDQDLDLADSVYTTGIVTVDNDTGTARTVTSVTRTSIRAVTVVMSGPLNGAAPKVTYGAGRTLSGATVVKSAAISLPTAINGLSSQPQYAESFFAQAVTIAGDAIAPTVVSASVTATQITIVFSEVVAGNAGFSVASSGGSVALSAPSGAGTNSRTYTLSRTIAGDESLSLAYSLSGDVADLSANALQPFSNYLLVNNAGGVYTAASNVRFGTDRGDGVTGTLRVPAASQVLQGTLVDATTGLLTVPAAGNVRNGIVYGAPTSVVTGTLVLPTVSQVQVGVSFGAGGTEFVGTLSPSSDSYTSVNNVLLGVDRGDGAVGTLRVPAVAQVQSGVVFGPLDTLTGTLTGSSGFALPISATVGSSRNKNIVVRMGETPTVRVTAVDANGTDVDLASLTLSVLFENVLNSTDIQTIADADITKSLNVATFTLPSVVSQSLSDKRWTMRTSDGVVIANGYVEVRKATVTD